MGLEVCVWGRVQLLPYYQEKEKEGEQEGKRRTMRLGKE